MPARGPQTMFVWHPSPSILNKYVVNPMLALCGLDIYNWKLAIGSRVLGFQQHNKKDKITSPHG